MNIKMKSKIHYRNKRMVRIKGRNNKKLMIKRLIVLTVFLVFIQMGGSLFSLYNNLFTDNFSNDNATIPPDKLELAQSTGNRLKVGVMKSEGDWDPAIMGVDNLIKSDYGLNALEKIAQGNANYSAGTKGQLIWEEWDPILCIDWDVEFWPEENNSLGFINSGGIKAINFTLRENVTFHDGSDWNASVMKWNIDRLYIISGNLTGNGDLTRLNDFWCDTDNEEPYFTPNWNLSEYDAPVLVVPPPVPLNSSNYSYYYLNDTYQIFNPNPYGGWDIPTNSPMHYAPYDKFPMVRMVEVVEDLPSGGKVRVEWNYWNQNGMDGIWEFMISMHSYKDYYDKPINGWDNDDPLYPDHLIGTGPYKYMDHDEVAGMGSMEKYTNYWNRTALETEGWYNIDFIDIISYQDTDARNTAFYTHSIDIVYDNMFNPTDYDFVIANPDIEYYEAGVLDYVTQITLNSINETWWAWPWADTWRKSFYTQAGNESADGVPRAMREAMSYAFNYDLYINNVTGGREVRSGMLGVNSVYYNSSTPLADYNVTKAREILLTTGADTSGEVYTLYGDWEGYWPDEDLYNFSKMCADRGLDENSTDNEWQLVADTNPIYVFNYYWDSSSQGLTSVLITSLKDIGCVIVEEPDNKVPTIIWDTVQIGHLTTFDGEHSLFSCNGFAMDCYMPHAIPEPYIYWANADPDKGRWRLQPLGMGSGGITSWHYWGNYGFNFDAEVDSWIDRLSYTNQTEKEYWINKIAEKEQAEIYPSIYVSQSKSGWVFWSEWEAENYWGNWHSYALTKFDGPVLVEDTNLEDNFFKFNYGADLVDGFWTLDPQNVWDTDSLSVIDQVCEGLFQYNLSDPNLAIIPNLAAGSSVWSSDNLNYTVGLKRNITFHDGTKFNASAVQWSFDRLAFLMNSTGVMTDLNLTIMDGLYRFDDGTRIINRTEIVNEFCVKFVLNKPFAALPGLLCFHGSYILSPNSISATEYINTTIGDLVGTGPFVYDAYIPDKEVHFHAFDNYWRGKAQIEVLRFVIVTNQTESLLSGEVDLINSPSYDSLNTLGADHNIDVIDTGVSPAFYYLEMNNNKLNKTWRQAISYAINYSYILNDILEGSAVRMQSPVPDCMLYSNTSNNIATLNITKARERMQSMGFGEGWDTAYLGGDEALWTSATFATDAFGTPLDLNLFISNTGVPSQNNLALNSLLMNDLSKIGIDLIETERRWTWFLDNLTYTPENMSLWYVGWGPDFNDPSSNINPLFSNSSINYAQINDTYLQNLIDNGLNETDPTARKIIYDEIQRYLVEDLMPWAFLWQYRNYDASFDYVEGYQYNPWDKVRIYDVSLNSSQYPGNLYVEGNQEWEILKNLNWCTGNGNSSDPYVINNLDINGQKRDRIGIIIRNSDVYFIIENCTIFNSTSLGILMMNVTNSQSIDNNCSNNNYGIFLYQSNNNNLSMNIANNNNEYGVYLYQSNNTIVIGNVLNSNGLDGYFENNSINNDFIWNINNGYLEPFEIDDSGGGEYTWAEAASQFAWLSGSGTYPDPYIIEEVIINGNHSGNCILIKNSNLFFRIQNCTVLNSGLYIPSSYAGIKLENVNNSFLIDNNCSFNDGAGIVIDPGYNNSIIGNDVYHNGYAGIHLKNGGSHIISGNTVVNSSLGIFLNYIDEIEIIGNTADNNTIGIFLLYGNDNNVTGNEANGNNFGIDIIWNDNARVLGNNATNNYIDGILSINNNNSIISGNIVNNNNIDYESLSGGIRLSGNNISLIWGNTITNNNKAGINVYNSNYTRIEGNTIDNNENGIYLNESTNNVVTGNSISNSLIYGIYLINVTHTFDNTIYNNTFVLNSFHAFNNGTNTLWYYGILGNYWDNYLGVDADDDGIGDIPYLIPGFLSSQDNFPIWDDGINVVPIITIISPSVNDIFGNTAPTFSVWIFDADGIDLMWYTLDAGVTNTTFTTNGTIDQTSWNALAAGWVTIRFYAEDTTGKKGTNAVTVIKSIGYQIISPLVVDDTGGGDYTWAEVATEFWCVGSGTVIDPYIIEKIVIEASTTSCLEIRNSMVYFEIRNSTFTDSGSGPMDAGIKLFNVLNGILDDVNCSENNNFGIILENCSQIIVQNSDMNDNVVGGIYLLYSNNNYIVDNGETINNNGEFGIKLNASIYNIITGNYISGNYYGIYIFQSNYTLIDTNFLIENDKAIIDEESLGTDIGDDNIIENIPTPGGIDNITLIIIVSIGAVVALGITGASVWKKKIIFKGSKRKGKPKSKDDSELREKLQQELYQVDKLIVDQNNELVIKKLNEIKKIASKNNLPVIFNKAEEKMQNYLDSRLEMVDRVKDTILASGIKYSKMQITDIIIESEVRDENMIVSTLEGMIHKKEIFGNYNPSSKEIKFDIQANIANIGELKQIPQEREEIVTEKVIPPTPPPTIPPKIEKVELEHYTVFISYSTLDTEYFQVSKIVRRLELYPDIDKVLFWEADSKQNIVEFMDETLKKCNVFILFCTERSMGSAAVKDEWQAAFQRRKKGLLKLIPVYEKEEHVPAILGHLLNVQYDKTDFDRFIEKLHQEIQR